MICVAIIAAVIVVAVFVTAVPVADVVVVVVDVVSTQISTGSADPGSKVFLSCVSVLSADKENTATQCILSLQAMAVVFWIEQRFVNCFKQVKRPHSGHHVVLESSVFLLCFTIDCRRRSCCCCY